MRTSTFLSQAKGSLSCCLAVAKKGVQHRRPVCTFVRAGEKAVVPTWGHRADGICDSLHASLFNKIITDLALAVVA